MPYRSYAEFARTKGAKDKGQRKSRAGLVAGGIAGAGAAGYGGSLAYRTRQGQPSRVAGLLAPAKGGAGVADWERNARARAGSAVDAAKGAAGDGRLSTLRNKGRFERMGDVARGDLAKVKQALGRSTSNSKYLGKTLGGNIARAGGAGLLAAGGTAAVLSYLKNRKKKDTSLRGRATSALNRMRGR